MHDALHNFHAYKKALPCTRSQKYGVTRDEGYQTRVRSFQPRLCPNVQPFS